MSLEKAPIKGVFEKFYLMKFLNKNKFKEIREPLKIALVKKI